MCGTKLTLTVGGHTEVFEGSEVEVRKKLAEAGKNFRKRVAERFNLPKPCEDDKEKP